MSGTKPVPELDNQLRQVLKFSGFMLLGLCLALFLYPGDTVLWGITVGIGTGIYNSITLAKRIKRLPDLSPDSAKKHMKKGLTMRLILIMAVLFVVGRRFPFISLFGVGAGILVPSYISIILSMVESIKLYRQSAEFVKKYYGK